MSKLRIQCLFLALMLEWAVASVTATSALARDASCPSLPIEEQAKNVSVNATECVDDHVDCEWWASEGECDDNANYMWQFCRKSCDTCKGFKELKLDMGVKQTISGRSIDPEHEEELKELLEDTKEYMENVVFKDPKYLNVRRHCRNLDGDCTYLAHQGECEESPDYMNEFCPLACKSCMELDENYRCHYTHDDNDATAAWGPGDLNKMFERIVTDPLYLRYQPRILSRPTVPMDDKTEILQGPWVVVLDNFLSDEESDTLIEVGMDIGYKRSADVGRKRFDGTYEAEVNEDRTSKNSWCGGFCLEDSNTQRILQRIENVTGIPSDNGEMLQLLKYEKGQFYRTHHDLIAHQRDRPCGVRILTFFLYLNDVELGGGTNFPELGLTVQPKKGRALIWPSVLDEDPNERDDRTDHQALPVKAGVKYGANAWIHQRNFVEPFERRCV
ncbi:Prolyl 4-hydroxylase subunit alpha-1 [Seminavis robusta]|uniref:Prolyl 4-hydroxylase subunit alpha-1 n=1 Tax=Seminavis robusta TaxID=568900 RepID=A0A9N8HLV8_9STRA|nr:Prolyl 4-hydroxylase subunit alpha-1 [Seminavis robusta]|eukprot:Sro1062_g236900.1 Prolyl 4-hydroxylase subunit alpha-1 (444) ;mRNA; f:6860-8658